MHCSVIPKSPQLKTYLTTSLGIGCSVSVANAVVVLDPFTGNGQNASLTGGGQVLLFGDPYEAVPVVYGGYYFSTSTSGALFGGIGGNFAFRGTDLVSPINIDSTNTFFEYNYNLPAGSVGFGAVVGDDNFVFFDQDNNGVFETLLRFDLDGDRNGELLGAAVENTGENIDFAEGVEILGGGNSGGGSIPEPSQHVALLGLGAAGLIARRRNKKAA